RSASMTMTASPLACSSPAVTAASFPKFRLNLTRRMPGVRVMTLRMYSAQPSSLPSSTSTSSWRRLSVSRTEKTRSKNKGSTTRSLNTGTTSDSKELSGDPIGNSKFDFIKHQPPVDDVIKGRDKTCSNSLGERNRQGQDVIEQEETGEVA